MSRRIRRRDFVSRTALGLPLLPLLACGDRDRGPAATAITADTLIADLERLIPRLMQEAVVPGLSIAIIENGQLSWARGFGVKDNASREPVNENTVFSVESVSKTVFAYAVMKLCERGVLNLDTPLTKYVSTRFLDGDPRLDLITARHVLSHTTGFQDWRSGDNPLKIAFTPGERWQYSGEGYSYLQSVVTRLTGRVDPSSCDTFEAGLKVCASDIDSYMKANLFVPFGMRSSSYVWMDAYENQAARPHDAKGTPLEKRKGTATTAARYAAAGQLQTTAIDYARFLTEVVDPKASDAFRLNMTNIQEMLRPQVNVSAGDRSKHITSISWALGWEVDHWELDEGHNGDVINHAGANSGFQAYVAASAKKKCAFVIMANSDNGANVIENLVVSGPLQRFLVG
jgi:CubicO group peptidase (beta-lactamase class C family)